MVPPYLRYALSLPRRMCTTFLLYPPRRVFAVMCGLGLVLFGFVRRGLPPQGPSGESYDDSDSVKVSTEVTEEEEPSVVHCDASLSFALAEGKEPSVIHCDAALAEGEEPSVIHCDATPSSTLAEGEEPSAILCDATPSSTLAEGEVPSAILCDTTPSSILAEGEEPNAIHCDDATPPSALAEGEEPSAIHCDAAPSSSLAEGEEPCDATPSSSLAEGEAVGKRAAAPGQDVGSVKRPRTEEDFESSEYVVDTTDEFYCEYDSTWETSRSHSRSTDRLRSSSNRKFVRFRNAARDMQNFRDDYPQEKTRYKQRNQEEYPNLDFYLRKRRSSPDGIDIDQFHNEWFQDYYKLENVHTFIQWLFPLQEPGVNYEAVELTKKEIKAFLKDEVAKENLLKSYMLMLDFYGIKLSNEATGEVQRASNWEERFANLNRNTHNNQRISRILKCLGTLGFRHYQAPLVRFFLHETLVNEVLPSVKESVLNYFLFAVLDKGRRRSLIKFAYQSYKPREEFVWCPRKIQTVWSTEETGEDVNPKPIQVPSADGSNDKMAEKVHGNL